MRIGGYNKIFNQHSVGRVKGHLNIILVVGEMPVDLNI